MTINTYLMGLFGFKRKEEKEILDRGLVKTRENVFTRLTRAVAGKSKIDDDVLDNLEEVLVSSDVGVETTLRIIDRVSKRVARDKYVGTAELNTILRDEIAALLDEDRAASTLTLASTLTFDSPLPVKPYVIMVVGVNGVGKTTTIAKLAYNFSKAGKNVLLGAADTFRAAAIDQLKIWSERAGVPMISQQMGSDPASVAFDTVRSAVASGTDVVIIDTAGRLHNKIGLMNEISQVISNELKINMVSVKMDVRNGVFTGTIKLVVKSSKHLAELLRRISGIRGVDRAVRLD